MESAAGTESAAGAESAAGMVENPAFGRVNAGSGDSVSLGADKSHLSG